MSKKTKKTLEVLDREEFFRLYQEEIDKGTEKLKGLAERVPNDERAVFYFEIIDSVMGQLEEAYRNRTNHFMREAFDGIEFVYWREDKRIGATPCDVWEREQAEKKARSTTRKGKNDIYR